MQMFSDLENKETITGHQTSAYRSVWASATLVVASELSLFQELSALPEYMTAKSITVNP